MIFNLSWKNFKGQFLNYLVYFVSMTFAVVVYYCFSAITYNRSLANRVGQEIHINGAMNLGGILIVIMILGFMFAANHFFLLKRGKEIGLYHLIGMRKSQISFLFFVETLILGAVSLVTGIVLGIIFSKLFSMILAKAMFLQVESLFFISIPSMIQTSLVFLFMLFAVSLRSSWRIYRYQVTNLLKPTEKKAVKSNKMSLLDTCLGILGIVLIGTGYFLSYNVISFSTVFLHTSLGIVGFLMAPLVIMYICMVGTYLFFKYTMYLVVFFFGKNKSHYYRNLNMLALGNTKQHIKRGGNTLSAVTIFIAIALGMIGGAASFYTIGMNSVNITAPTDFIVAEENFKEIAQVIEKEPDTKIDSLVKLNYKLTGSQFHLKIGQEEKQQTLSPINLLSLSNYHEFQKINPYLKNIELKKEHDIVILDSIPNILGGFIRYDSTFILSEGIKLHVADVRADYLGQDLLRYNFPTVVVSDKQFGEINSGISYTLSAFNIQAKDEEALANKLSEAVKPKWITPVYHKYQWVNNQLQGYISKTSQQPQKEKSQVYSEDDEQEFWQLNYTSRFSDLRYKRREMGLFIYVAMFLGILALIITGSILMLQQFSEAEREKGNYDLLKKLGVPKNEITKLIYQQNSIIFFPPMIIGVLHATFAIYVFSKFITSSGYWLAYLSCGILILIYLTYYFLTSAIYSRMIHGKDRQ
ncbi:ABC transporter permease [Candidatus Enterococcus ikei]|uniref:ABC transporter permease n=1 Tax=Candidatus Enterococcus ikei TaxID=2815326 RepID=A0ABS3H079_9ENTE|nr:ABC transporter permease [Enterococcus sp. DIV0869a]MBO0440495.1 ABC transporter permease [Enterococcus sp. DIV0869a]